MRTTRLLYFLFIAIAISCSPKKKEKEIIVFEEEDTSQQVSLAGIGKEKLSEYNFFEMPLANLKPAAHVFPYEMNTPLFTDYALKKRFVFIPDGKTITFQEKEVLDFPVGAVLIKNFYYDETQLTDQKKRIIETRLLIHEESGWKALPYIWNDEQTEAYLEIAGGDKLITINNKEPFSYSVPNMAQCKSCHELNGTISPIGPTTRQLNRNVHGENQLVHLKEAGVLINLPDFASIGKLAVWDDKKTGSLDDRARAYLEINCGHCHRPEGPGKNSGLDLTVFSASSHSLGIYKAPVAAGAGSGGLQYDITPGKPDESILTYRMTSIEPGTMMPELGRKLIHEEGVELINEWIGSLK